MKNILVIGMCLFSITAISDNNYYCPKVLICTNKLCNSSPNLDPVFINASQSYNDGKYYLYQVVVSPQRSTVYCSYQIYPGVNASYVSHSLMADLTINPNYWIGNKQAGTFDCTPIGHSTFLVKPESCPLLIKVG